MAAMDIEFLNFEDAVAASKREPDIPFVGLHFVAPYTRLAIYTLSSDPDNEGFVCVDYEGGELFDEGGEEDFYALRDTPEEAKGLFYARMRDLADGNAHIAGMVSEYALHALLPGLDEAMNYDSEAAFVKDAVTKFQAFWRQS